jgi:hypothetical protein
LLGNAYTWYCSRSCSPSDNYHSIHVSSANLSSGSNKVPLKKFKYRANDPSGLLVVPASHTAFLRLLSLTIELNTSLKKHTAVHFILWWTSFKTVRKSSIFHLRTVCDLWLNWCDIYVFLDTFLWTRLHMTLILTMV